MGNGQEKCKNAGKLQEEARQSPAAATAAGLIWSGAQMDALRSSPGVSCSLFFRWQHLPLLRYVLSARHFAVLAQADCRTARRW